MSIRDEKIYKSIITVLENEEYNYSYGAIDDIYTVWRDNKTDLIELLRNHPNWNEEKKMVVFDSDFTRDIQKNVLLAFRDYIWCYDFDIRAQVPAASHNWMTTDKYPLLVKIWRYLHSLLNGDIYITTTNDTAILNLNEIIPELHAKVNEKTTRVIGRICKALGWNKLPNYEREYAKLCDALTPMTIKRHTILSVNPVDYLYMSNGNSWHSCHDIRTDGSEPGCYSSGTVSYMLDDCSMIWYTVDKDYDGDAIEFEPKIQRQVFAYKDGQLLQSRLYPSRNDGDTDRYNSIRALVQDIIATCENAPNLWKKRNNFNCTKGDYATLYPDWEYGSNNATFTTLNSVYNDDDAPELIIGDAPICIYCGKRHEVEKNIDCCHSECYVCEDCGRPLDEEEAIWIDGEPYCLDCVYYCDYCNEYHRNDDITYVDSVDEYVCEYCLDRYFKYCECCGYYYEDVEMQYVDFEEDYVCRDCIAKHYTECEDCGALEPNDIIEEYVDNNGEVHQLCSNCIADRLEAEIDGEDESEVA